VLTVAPTRSASACAVASCSSEANRECGSLVPEEVMARLLEKAGTGPQSATDPA
jgi:hypothetical protein